MMTRVVGGSACDDVSMALYYQIIDFKKLLTFVTKNGKKLNDISGFKPKKYFMIIKPKCN